MKGVPHRFSVEEWAGALGDYGTLIPVAFGVALTTGMDIGPILLGFSLAYIASGLYYRLPVPVEPMKAIGALAIAGGLTAGQVVASGYLLGIMLMVLGLSGAMGLLSRVVPRPVTRGIQLGLGLILIQTALGFVATDPWIGGLAAAAILVFAVARIRDISALVVIVFGVAVGIARHGLPVLSPWVPALHPLPPVADFGHALVAGVLPQLPLTVANAILATALLLDDLLGHSVPESRLAGSIGVMCLLGAPIGAMPMCHGSGGLAAQYRFGSRTGGSNIISGLILLPVALLLASRHTLLLIPPGVLGALLAFSALELLRAGARTTVPAVTLVTGVLAVVTNLGTAFITGLMLDRGWRHISRHHTERMRKKSGGQSTDPV